MDWFNEEIAALESQLKDGLITKREYNEALFELRVEFEKQDYIQSMIDAGRGHLLK